MCSFLARFSVYFICHIINPAVNEGLAFVLMRRPFLALLNTPYTSTLHGVFIHFTKPSNTQEKELSFFFAWKCDFQSGYETRRHALKYLWSIPAAKTLNINNFSFFFFNWSSVDNNKDVSKSWGRKCWQYAPFGYRGSLVLVCRTTNRFRDKPDRFLFASHGFEYFMLEHSFIPLDFCDHVVHSGNIGQVGRSFDQLNNEGYQSLSCVVLVDEPNYIRSKVETLCKSFKCRLLSSWKFNEIYKLTQSLGLEVIDFDNVFRCFFEFSGEHLRKHWRTTWKLPFKNFPFLSACGVDDRHSLYRSHGSEWCVATGVKRSQFGHGSTIGSKNSGKRTYTQHIGISPIFCENGSVAAS